MGKQLEFLPNFDHRASWPLCGLGSAHLLPSLSVASTQHIALRPPGGQALNENHLRVGMIVS